MLVVAHTLVTYLRSVLLVYLRARLDTTLMYGFVEHLLSLPFAFFQQRTSGDLLMRVNSNSALREMLTNQTLSLLLDGTFLLVYLVVLVIASPSFAIGVSALGAAQLALIAATRRRQRELADREVASQAAEQSYLVEAMQGIAVLKASGAEDRAYGRWSTLFARRLQDSTARGQLSAGVDAIVGGLRVLSPLLLLWLGATRVLSGDLSLGEMLALLGIAAAFLTPLTTLLGSVSQIQPARAFLERVVDVLDAKPEQASGSGAPIALRGAVEFRDVSFRYDANSPLALDGISFTVHPGHTVALVGRTGSGKTTAAMLALGLHALSGGEILVDGVPLASLSLRDFRSQVGVVLQDGYVFSGSIRQNVTLNDPSIPLAAVHEATRLAGIYDDILAMPMRFETLVAEGGSSLSGGQRQRIAIARALARRPALLVLDEATSHLDAATEAVVTAHLATVRCTCLVIAHRLSTVRRADHIVVLDQGRVVEQGTHGTLVARGGAYQRLFLAQLTAEPAGSPPSRVATAA